MDAKYRKVDAPGLTKSCGRARRKHPQFAGEAGFGGDDWAGVLKGFRAGHPETASRISKILVEEVLSFWLTPRPGGWKKLRWRRPRWWPFSCGCCLRVRAGGRSDGWEGSVMDCYHCPHAAAIARGDYADVSWQDTPCFGCGSDDSLLPYREAGQIDERLVKDGRARTGRRGFGF